MSWTVSSAGRASGLHPEGREFNPLTVHSFRDVAQLVAHLVWDQRVAGSNPVVPT